METRLKIRKMSDMTDELQKSSLDSPHHRVLRDKIKQLALPAGFMQTVETHYMTIARVIAQRFEGPGNTLLVSINGAQGSGKSTLTEFLEVLLASQYGLRVANLSLDDFYLTRSAREQRAREIHPLLATRGVPGTHDVDLAVSTFDCLRSGSPDGVCQLPRFDKSRDDRQPETMWPSITVPVDVILFEGWCNHAPVQDEQQLATPINTLESEEDPQGDWRSYVNRQLEYYHRTLFRATDLLIFLQAPSFEKVYEWRELQETKLKSTAPRGSHVMNRQQLERFIQHYERLTRGGLDHLPQQADILVRLDDDHRIVTVSGREVDGDR
jgi:D-glycerate 3-kinase